MSRQRAIAVLILVVVLGALPVFAQVAPSGLDAWVQSVEDRLADHEARLAALEDVTPTSTSEPNVTSTTLDVTSTTLPSTTTSTLPPTTTTLPPETTTTVPSGGPNTFSVGPNDLMVTDPDHPILTLRPGDRVEFTGGAQLMVNAGTLDWQGSETTTWSDDGLTFNLERDVELAGDGSVMVMDGADGPHTIRYVEFDLQPDQELGHYPLHFHLNGDASRGTLVEGTVVKNSTNRAYVAHASHGVTFRDTIAHTIQGPAYWWDPPAFQSDDRTNNTEDVLYDRVLAHTVTNAPGDNRGFRLGAFVLGAGIGNTVRDSVARGVHPSHVKDCSGFLWPELSHRQDRVWTFENNATFDSDCHGIFVWQNGNDGPHIQDGFRGDPISHGAYGNDYRYFNVDVSGVIVHAVGWSIDGGSLGDVNVVRQQFDGTVTFSNVDIGSLTFNNASNGGVAELDLILDNVTGISCADIDWQSRTSGSSVVLNGQTCQP